MALNWLGNRSMRGAEAMATGTPRGMRAQVGRMHPQQMWLNYSRMNPRRQMEEEQAQRHQNRLLLGMRRTGNVY